MYVSLHKLIQPVDKLDIEEIQSRSVNDPLRISLEAVESNLRAVMRLGDKYLEMQPHEYTLALRRIREAADLELNYIENRGVIQ